ncbi:MAG: signal peptide peptidase SppA [Pseudomonadales bacterium]
MTDLDLQTSQSNSDDPRAWQLVERVVDRSLNEQRKARRWGIFFKLLTFAYLFGAVALFWPRTEAIGALPSGSHVAMVQIKGVIADEEMANANAVAGSLRKAFENDECKAIMLTINSPGGSPVQSGMIYDEINRLQEIHPDKPVYASISDLGASGAYYIAVAADHIYADKASLVGSIGVVGSSFGFVDTMEKLGVERRMFTAGEHKGFLDPFSPLNDAEKTFWEGVLQVTHNQFIATVREGRGDRLKDNPDLFSGLVWSGEQALEMGLIDGLGSAGYVAREVIGEENIVDYSHRLNPLERVVRQLGASMGDAIVSSILGTTALKLH